MTVKSLDVDIPFPLPFKRSSKDYGRRVGGQNNRDERYGNQSIAAAIVFRAGFNRPNLHYSVEVKPKSDMGERIADIIKVRARSRSAGLERRVRREEGIGLERGGLRGHADSRLCAGFEKRGFPAFERCWSSWNSVEPLLVYSFQEAQTWIRDRELGLEVPP